MHEWVWDENNACCGRDSERAKRADIRGPGGYPSITFRVENYRDAEHMFRAMNDIWIICGRAHECGERDRSRKILNILGGKPDGR